MTPRAAVRACLESGPKTAEQVALITGLPQDRCHVILAELCAIEPGISKRKVTLYRMPGGNCEWPGCGQQLRATNGTGFCSSHVRAAAKREWQSWTDAEKRRFLDAYCDGFDIDASDQMELEAVNAP